MLSLLYYQQTQYTSELGKSHHTLSKLYKKLEKTEQGLTECKERGLTRKDKKKLQWDRAITKSSVKAVETEQAFLHEHLRQCSDLIASYYPDVYQYSTVPWTSHLSPTAYPFFPNCQDSPSPESPWFVGPFEERVLWNNHRHAPLYWDLSMLQELGHYSPMEALSGFGLHEPARQGASYQGSFSTMSDAVSHGSETLDANGSTRVSALSNRSSLSEKDTLPELIPASLPVKLGAENMRSLHRRRYSENAVQLIESRLKDSQSSKAEHVPAHNRTASETRFSKEV
ncbi:hypothetical protein WHR41_03930 [Cladosporium halotolerans]|uniref:Uncharacterized protein n=1 Tax=Cladosporium halotolerans TaxID=1052096 RepID=A0AB34KW72_9PEZI